MTKLLIQLNRVTLLRKLLGDASGLDGALLIRTLPAQVLVYFTAEHEFHFWDNPVK